MNEAALTQRFIRESLPLLASFFYSEQVQLEPSDVGVGEESSEEYERFARLLRMRHAVACGLKLKPIVEAIERGASHVSEIVRAESKGAINGRLDIQLYLNRRSTNLSWPRTFPVLIARDTPNTPENQLVAYTLRQVVRRLNESAVSDVSAERSYCLNLLRWSREKLHADPWSRVVPARNADRLKRETEHRLRKRQTGNEPAYRHFLNWYKQWEFDASRADAEETDNLVNLLLAFPPGDFFQDRVFEIWCLSQVIEAFRRCGAVVEAGPRPLSQRAATPICDMSYNGFHFAIWFQRSLPSAMARWKYVHSGRPLVGIPDITVLGDGGRRLLFDAKRREVLTQTRSEETYKVIGYLENFRDLFDGLPYYCVLCFLSSNDLYTEVITGSDDKVFLVGAHPDDPTVCALGGRMDSVVSEWLSAATS